jgi:hypothetical protein
LAELVMDEDVTRVMFRRWPKSQGAGIIALFPDIPSDLAGRFCLSYEHVGQHGGADYQGVIGSTRPAASFEYEPLRQELVSIGYDLKIRSRR